VYALAISVVSGWAGLLASYPLWVVSAATAVEQAAHALRAEEGRRAE
jgi:hypothetical protein